MLHKYLTIASVFGKSYQQNLLHPPALCKREGAIEVISRSILLSFYLGCKDTTFFVI